jgi:hypothetical protein
VSPLYPPGAMPTALGGHANSSRQPLAREREAVGMARKFAGRGTSGELLNTSRVESDLRRSRAASSCVEQLF